MSYRTSCSYKAAREIDLAALLTEVADRHPAGYGITLRDYEGADKAYDRLADLVADLPELDITLLEEAEVTGRALSYSLLMWSSPAEDGEPADACVSLLALEPDASVSVDAYEARVQAVQAAWEDSLKALSIPVNAEVLTNLPAVRAELAAA